MKLFYLTIIIFAGYIGNCQPLEQGKKYLYYERLSSAEESFRQAIQQQPANGEAWYNLVKTYFMLNQPKLDFDTLLNAPAGISKDLFFRIAEGFSFIQKNSKDAAVAYFDNILKEKKKKNANIVAAIAWAQINSPNGNVNYAINILKNAIKKNKQNAELYVLLGDAWRKQFNGSEAFKAYQNAINEDKNYAVAYYRMGQIFLSQKNRAVYSDYFQKAVAADPDFSPAWYKLYIYEFNRDPAKAMTYYSNYSKNADHTIQTEYDMADLHYLNHEYDQAIARANSIIRSEGDSTQPRIYKLISYSLAGKKDTIGALNAMINYFKNEQDSNIISKDYETMSAYYSASPGQDSLAAVYLAKATTLEEDSTVLFNDYKKLADMAADRKDYQAQSHWLGKYCRENPNASNLDLFYWGIANYRIENYMKADTIFGMYIAKYPDQSFGYYWQAKSKALQDTSMSAGLAIPVYEKLVEVLNKDTTDENYKKWIIEAYGYLAAYAVNTVKDYAKAIGYFQQILTLDPENTMAKKYVDMLNKLIKDKGDSASETVKQNSN